MKPLVSIIAPMFNEESLVTAYTDAVREAIAPLEERYAFELVLTDDGSRDRTLGLMLAQRSLYPGLITVIALTRNFGLEGAIHAALSRARGDYVVVMDADLQDPPSLIPKLLEKAAEGFDVVQAVRAARPADSAFKRHSAELYYRLLQRLAGRLPVERNAANYRLLSRRAVEAVNALPEANPTFRISVPYTGFKTATVLYEREQRVSGRSKYDFAALLRCALDGVTGISTAPLSLPLKLIPAECLVFMICLLLCLVVPPAWTAALAIITVLMLLSVIFTGILAIMAEYIGQIMVEVKRRPVSLIDNHLPSGSAAARLNGDSATGSAEHQAGAAATAQQEDKS